MNIAKLTSVDLPLFNGVMSDLFPGIETPVIDYSKVTKDSSSIYERHEHCQVDIRRSAIVQWSHV